MLKNIFIKSGALLLIAPSFIFAQNLSQLLDLSKDNKLLDATNKGVQSIKLEYESVKNAYMPNLTLGAKAQATNKETNSTPDRLYTAYGNLTYTIYDGGKKQDTYDSYESTINSANKNLEFTKNQIHLEVIKNYYSYLAYVSQKEAKLQEIEQLKAQQTRLQRFLEVGTTTKDEVEKIISNVEKSNVELHEIYLNIETILHNLEYLVGKQVNVEDGSKILEFIPKDENTRADIKALEYDSQAILANAKTKKSSNMPNLSISDTYTSYDMNYKTLGNSDEYEQNIVALNLSWKIFDFGATKKSYESAFKKYLASKSQYEYEKSKASIDLKLAIKAYEIGKLKINSATEALKAAQSTYNAIKIKFQNGFVDNISYLQALSEKYNAQSTLNSALYDLEIKKANIIYHSGKDLQEYIR